MPRCARIGTALAPRVIVRTAATMAAVSVRV